MPHIFVNRGRPCDRNVLCLDPIFAPPWIPPLLEAVSAGEKNLRRVHFPPAHTHTCHQKGGWAPILGNSDGEGRAFAKVDQTTESFQLSLQQGVVGIVAHIEKGSRQQLLFPKLASSWTTEQSWLTAQMARRMGGRQQATF